MTNSEAFERLEKFAESLGYVDRFGEKLCGFLAMAKVRDMYPAAHDELNALLGDGKITAEQYVDRMIEVIKNTRTMGYLNRIEKVLTA